MVNFEHLAKQVNSLIIGDFHVLLGLEATQRHIGVVFVAQPISDVEVWLQPVFLDVGTDGVAAYDLAYLEQLVNVVHSLEEN